MKNNYSYSGDLGTDCTAAGGHYDGKVNEGHEHGAPQDTNRYKNMKNRKKNFYLHVHVHKNTTYTKIQKLEVEAHSYKKYLLLYYTFNKIIISLELTFQACRRPG